jgi:hypothetical protein
MSDDLEALRAAALSSCAALLGAVWWELSDADDQMALAVRLDGGAFGVEVYLNNLGSPQLGLVVRTAGGRRKPIAWPASKE